MKKLSLYLVLFSIYSVISLSAQTSNELRILENPIFLQDQLVDNAVRDKNGDVCAGIIILSDINGLAYDSNNGIVKVNNKQGEDFLFLSPSERVIKIYGPEYIPLQIVLSDYGINLKSGQVWQIKITGDKKLDGLPHN